MIDIQLLRADIDAVAKRLATRGYQLNISTFTKLEEQRKKIQTSTEHYQAQRNSLSKLIGQAKAGRDQQQVDNLMAEVARFGDQLKGMEQENEPIQARLRDFVSLLPNLPHESVPVGNSSDQNVEVRRWGAPRKFDFAAKDHVDVGAPLGLDTSSPAALFLLHSRCLSALRR